MQHRSCSLHAVSARDCYILVIQKDKFRRALDTCKNRIKNEKFEFLKSVELISLFQRNSIKNLSKFIIRKRLNRSQMLYREGDPVDKIYFVLSGEFKVTKKIVLIDKKQEDNQSAIKKVNSASKPQAGAFPIN